MYRHTLIASLAACAAIAGSSVHAASLYKIDIGPSGGGVEPGYTELVSTFNGSGGSVTIDGDTFTLFGQAGARDRGTNSSLGVNEVTADFAFKEADAGGVEFGLHLGSAGALEAGLWQLSVYSADWHVPILGQIMGLYTNFDTPGQSEVIYGSSVDQVLDGPALTFQFTSDGVSAYSLFLRDSASNPTAGTDAEDKIRLNGIDVTRVPEPSSLALLSLGGLLIAFRRRRG